jgi:membrane protease YdiL (CAAX protease family)
MTDFQIAAEAPGQMPLGRSILLHLVPGALITAFYFLTAPAIQRAGLPPLAALLLAILIVLIPFELGWLLVLGHRRNGRLSLDGIVLYRQRLPWWNYALLIPAFLIWGALCFMLLNPVEGMQAAAWFNWMPAWSQPTSTAAQFGGYSRGAVLVTLAAGLVLNGFAGPIVEELYFRGYLLPRLSRFGALGSAAINVLLFSLYHFFTPWGNLTRIAALLPLVYTVARKRNIYLAMWTHVGLNTFGMLLSLALVAGQ